jgi:hypothetical protein
MGLVSLHHHDNAPAYSALSMHEFMARKKKEQSFPHTPYPQGLRSLAKLNRRRFNDITTIQAKLQGKFAEFQT